MDYSNDVSSGNAGSGQDERGTAGIPGKDDDKKLFVGGLSRQTTDRELKEYFSQFGDIESVTVKMDLQTGLSRGFAFIVFTSPKTIDKLLASGDHYIQKRKVDPKRVSKKVQHGKIFVGGLTPEISDDDIKSYFSQFGTIVEFQAPFDKQKNQRKGFCFITFDSKETMYNLLKTPKQYINGKEVDVKKVRANPEMGRAGGYGNYGGFGYEGGYGAYPYENWQYYDNFYNAGTNYDNNFGKPKNRQFSRHQPY